MPASYGSTESLCTKIADNKALEHADVEQSNDPAMISTQVPPRQRGKINSIFRSISKFIDCDNIMTDDSRSLQQLSVEAPSSKSVAAINLVNNVVGMGVLSMPAAVKAASLFTALALLTIIGVISAASFILIGYLCSRLQCGTYRQLWSRAFGARSSALIDVALVLNSAFSCLGFMILTADLVEKSYPEVFGTIRAPSRAAIIGVSTLVVILPLCHAKNLATLKYTSIIAVSAFIYVWTLFQFEFWSMTPRTTKLTHNLFKVDSGMFIAVSIFNSAFKAHTNAPIYLRELGWNFDAFVCVAATAFAVVLALYFAFCIAAFGLFGMDAQGNVLKNFPRGSAAILCAWLAMALKSLFSYPVAFKAGLESMFSLFSPLAHAQQSCPLLAHSVVVTSLVIAYSLAACILPDVSVVIGLSGATVGAGLCWSFPAAVFIRLSFPTKAEDGKPTIPWSYSAVGCASTVFMLSLYCMKSCTVVVLRG